MAEPIRISALGRDAQVGDLYNYLTDVIVPSGIDVPNERKTISDTVGDPKLSFIYQQPEKSKRHFLGINSHLLQNMKRGSVPGHQIWFSDYLNTNSMDGDEGHAQVTLLFRVVRRTETLNLDFLRSKIDDYQLKSAAGGTTHVIDEVVYGAEVICSMRKALYLSQETKESAEVSIYFAAKKYLDETIGKSTSLELPIELDQVPCTVLSSIKPGKKNEMSFHSFNLYLQNLLDTDKNRQKWKPMEFLLRNMSAAHIEAKLCSERKDDVALEKKHHQVNRKWITKEMMDISNDPSLKRFPLLEKFICYFRDLLPRFWKGIDETYQTLEMLPEEKVLEEMIYISDWLKKVMDLFACWRKDIREISWLLKDTDLVLLEMQEIEAQMTTKDCKLAKLFVLNFKYKQVPIVNDIEELVGQKTSTVMLPVLPSFSYEKEHIGCIRSALSQFANEARLANLSSSLGTSYYVALDSSTLENGAIVTIDYSGKSPIVISEDNPVEYLKKKQKHQLLSSSSSVSSCLPPPLIPTVASNHQTTKKSIMRKDHVGTSAKPDIKNFHFDQISLYEPNVSDQSTSSVGINIWQTRLHDNKRIAEIYADESRSYSKLIRNGSPNVYLLNATEKLNDDQVKWFEICRPGDPMRSRKPKNHKIIILMGATGSGKSTLINGMINYILGVRWNDPFRFKCVREDENAARNQAHSQTSSVTAYTLHHQEGMTIPYSITIIDTPGYGDTGGVKKNKEITTKIQSFLTKKETRIDEIHAACFVAASGDSRLTATQRYIIDSVLSIFGKDMKENLRLLVTFADNDDPPVVEACKLANFPATPASDGISYSKFNSAVLYCSNVIQENEFSFDELFQDMGQENFHKFFTMLAEMDGRNLTSTREVIQRRQQLEQSLKDIECELEDFLLNIEEIEKYRQKLRKYDHNMETNKNFVQEKTEMRLIKVDCDYGFKAYNCRICNNTCEMHLRSTYFQKRQCEDRSCQCSGSDHEFQPFAWTRVPVKVKTTRNDMKAEFEFNSNQKLKTKELMENCSHDLDIAKVKVIALLEQIGVNASSLDSTALRSNALNPTEYLSLMRSRILEEQPPGYEICLQTLTDLQLSWNTSAKLSAEKGQSRDSNVTTQPVKSDKTSRGRGSLLRTSATATVGALESKPGYYGKNGRDATPSRSSQKNFQSISSRIISWTKNWK